MKYVGSMNSRRWAAAIALLTVAALSAQASAQSFEPTPAPRLGACCLPDGSCTSTTKAKCDEQCGLWNGIGSKCTDDLCPETLKQACCNDGECNDMLACECVKQGGVPQGIGVFCSDTKCDGSGACCFYTGECHDLGQTVCEYLGGEFQGAGTDCYTTQCNTGACCLPDGSCIETNEEECAALCGDFNGVGSDCENSFCYPDPTGACCIETYLGEICLDVSSCECYQQGGTYKGDGTSCYTDPCEEEESCCLPDGTCVDGLTQDECLAKCGQPNLFPCSKIIDCVMPKGACCISGVAGPLCLELTECECAQATNGEYQGDGTVCEDKTCNETGACCLPDGTCVDTTQGSCESQCGVYQGNGTSCNGSEICEVHPTGACCLDESCSDVTNCQCDAAGGLYHGDGTSCDQNCCSPVTNCTVDIAKELFIRHPSVVDDPARTTCTGPNPADCGPWTFTAMMAAVAGTNDRAQLSAFVIDLLDTWDTNQTVNTDLVELRCQMRTKFIDPWIADSGGLPLDFSFAPEYFRLLAIVSRTDLRNDDPNLEITKAGEGRFVFGGRPASIINVGGQSTYQFSGGVRVHNNGVTGNNITGIFEFRLPGITCEDVLFWASQWHALAQHALPSAAYNNALQAITDQFATIGADPGRPNGSALAQFRFNENEFTFAIPGNGLCDTFPNSPGNGSFVWELREFRLFCSDGSQGNCSSRPLSETTVEQEPIRIHNNTTLLANYLTANSADILAGTYRVPLSFSSQAFRGGHSLVNTNNAPQSIPPPWTAPGFPIGNAVRNAFAINTCSGCHQIEFPGTDFTHVKPRNPGQQSPISGFLTGDLNNRAVDLCDVLEMGCCSGNFLGLKDGDGGDISLDKALPRPEFNAGRAH